VLWVKAFHIMAVICWFAALFYLPRLFVYHATATDKISKDRFIIMERKLYRGIGTPSMVATLILGFWLVSSAPQYYVSKSWFIMKLFIVSLLVIYHFICGYFLKTFREDNNTKSHVFYRIFNEIPVFGLVGAVILVVIKQPI